MTFLPKAAWISASAGCPGWTSSAGQFIGVHDLRAVFAEEPGGGGFAHAHAAGQTANLHGLESGAGRSRPVTTR